MFLDDEVTCEKKDYFRQVSGFSNLTAEIHAQNTGILLFCLASPLSSFSIRLTHSSTRDFGEWHSLKGRTEPNCPQLYILTNC